MKIEELTRTDIRAMNEEEMYDELKNYGVSLDRPVMDYKKEKLLEAMLGVKDKSEARLKKAKEEEKVQPIAPDVTKEEAKDPIAVLFEMGYETKEDVLRGLQALKKAKEELLKKEREITDKAAMMVEEELKLDVKRKTVKEHCKKLEQEYKTWQTEHDRIIAVKKK